MLNPKQEEQIKVEGDDGFCNRRMTRSALKRASSALEDDPEEKKPGVLSKKGGNQLEQQQEQHGEGNDATEVRQSLTGEALEEYERVQNKRWRPFTREERENYCKIVWGSEVNRQAHKRPEFRLNCHLGFPILSGFDAVDLPSYITNYGGLIRPVKQPNEKQLVLEKCSESAIATFNKKNKTKYRFVEVIKANYTRVSGVFYYITFVAKDKEAGSNKNFQAFVRVHFERITVQFCRLEQPPKEVVEYNFKDMRKKDPNKPKKPSPTALKWFWEEFTNRYKEKHPNASDEVVGQACRRAWRSMDAAAREPYEQIAAEKKAEYHKNLEAYNRTLAEGRVEEEESDNLRSQVNDEDKDKDKDDERKNKKSRRKRS